MRALVVVDVQRDFCEGGSLAVNGGKELARRIYQELLPIISTTSIGGVWAPPNTGGYGFRLATKDFHNDSDNHGHISDMPNYASTWPRHCIRNTSGANFMHPLTGYYFNDVFKKGRGIAAYSGFQGVGVASGLTLDEYLRSNNIDTIDVCGIALDHCVRATVDDAITLGYNVNVLADYTVAVDEGLRDLVLHNLRGRGANIV